jgi:hypothetical protein
MGGQQSKPEPKHHVRRQQIKNNHTRHQLQSINNDMIQQNVQKLFHNLQGGSRLYEEDYTNEHTDTISFVQHGGLDKNVLHQLKQAMNQIDSHDLNSDLELSATSPFMVNPAHVLKGGKGSSSSSSSSSSSGSKSSSSFGSSSVSGSGSSSVSDSSSSLPTTVQHIVHTPKHQSSKTSKTSKPSKHSKDSSSTHSNSSSTTTVSTVSSSSSSSSDSYSSPTHSSSSHSESSETTQVHKKNGKSKRIFHKNEESHSESSIHIVPFYSSDSYHSTSLRRYSQKNRRFI